MLIPILLVIVALVVVEYCVIPLINYVWWKRAADAVPNNEKTVVSYAHTRLKLPHAVEQLAQAVRSSTAPRNIALILVVYESIVTPDEIRALLESTRALIGSGAAKSISVRTVQTTKGSWIGYLQDVIRRSPPKGTLVWTAPTVSFVTGWDTRLELTYSTALSTYPYDESTLLFTQHIPDAGFSQTSKFPVVASLDSGAMVTHYMPYNMEPDIPLPVLTVTDHVVIGKRQTFKKLMERPEVARFAECVPADASVLVTLACLKAGVYPLSVMSPLVTGYVGNSNMVLLREHRCKMIDKALVDTVMSELPQVLASSGLYTSVTLRALGLQHPDALQELYKLPRDVALRVCGKEYVSKYGSMDSVVATANCLKVPNAESIEGILDQVSMYVTPPETAVLADETNIEIPDDDVTS